MLIYLNISYVYEWMRKRSERQLANASNTRWRLVTYARWKREEMLEKHTLDI